MHLIGTKHADKLDGSADSDIIIGLSGGDQITGGDGGDLVLGGNGDDTIYADSEERGYVPGTAPGDDTIFGGDGDDFVLGGFGNDLLIGGAGSDLLVGDEGNDLILGGAGGNRMSGGGGVDTLIGGTGDDQYSTDDSVNDIVDLFVFGAMGGKTGFGHDLIPDFNIGDAQFMFVGYSVADLRGPVQVITDSVTDWYDGILFSVKWHWQFDFKDGSQLTVAMHDTVRRMSDVERITTDPVAGQDYVFV